MEMDVNEESVAPWKLDGGWYRAESSGGMSDVTTATGCAVSRRRARILWDKPCAFLQLLVLTRAAVDEDQRFVETTAERNIVTKKGSHHCEMDGYLCLSVLGSTTTRMDGYNTPRRSLPCIFIPNSSGLDWLAIIGGIALQNALGSLLFGCAVPFSCTLS